jgi:UDP-N-acetylmuramyl tripeptide synthase
VISDGLPDSQESALASAERITGIIDVIYCGPDSDAGAIAFMQRLARTGGGRVVVNDIRRNDRASLAIAVRKTLALPAPRQP